MKDAIGLDGTLKPLRERVAQALYEAAPSVNIRWDGLSPERKEGWYSDADICLAIVLRAAAWVADVRDPEKPCNYLFRREHISSNIMSLRHGWPEIHD